MPEPTNCQQLQLSKPQNFVKCSDRVETVEKRVQEKLPKSPDFQENSKINSDFRPRATKNISNVDKNVAGNEEAVESRCEENSGPSPLGPNPRENSAEFWAPLADLTKSRPAVENLSTTRFSPAEWNLHNDSLLKKSHEIVNKELLTELKSHRCLQRVFAQTDRDKQDNNIKLSSRLNLIGRWKIELKRQVAEFPGEIRKIHEERNRLLRCSHAVTLIKSINQDVKKVRCMRIESELVRDEVEDQLSNEWDLCEDVQNVYTRCLDQVQLQLQELKDAKRRVELDLTAKKEAWKIDVTCRGLDSSSEILEWKAGSAQMPGDQSTPTDYDEYCKEAIAMSQSALQSSRILRSNLHEIYEKSVRDLRAQADRVDIALTKKIDELVQIRRRMENELKLCLKSLADAEALVEKSRAGTRRLDGAMKCAQTRLGLRLARNNVENCRDTPQFGLIDEVKNLSEGVSAILSQIESANVVIDDLTKFRKKLEKDLAAKTKSLWVDRDRCQLLRSFYPSIQVLAGR